MNRVVLVYRKLQAVIDDADEFVELLALAAIVVTPRQPVELVRDPNDDRFIEAAQAGRADVIVTGGAIKVSSPSDMTSRSRS